jgi:putative addiction module component (TIGR02574 family)
VTDETRSVFDAALALPEKDRAALAQLLLESLSEMQEDVSDDELLAELERRSAEADRGAADAVPWSELRDEE